MSLPPEIRQTVVSSTISSGETLEVFVSAWALGSLAHCLCCLRTAHGVRVPEFKSEQQNSSRISVPRSSLLFVRRTQVVCGLRRTTKSECHDKQHDELIHLCLHHSHVPIAPTPATSRSGYTSDLPLRLSSDMLLAPAVGRAEVELQHASSESQNRAQGVPSPRRRYSRGVDMRRVSPLFPRLGQAAGRWARYACSLFAAEPPSHHAFTLSAGTPFPGPGLGQRLFQVRASTNAPYRRSLSRVSCCMMPLITYNCWIQHTHTCRHPSRHVLITAHLYLACHV